MNEERAAIARYVIEQGVVEAARKFCVNESTVQTLRRQKD